MERRMKPPWPPLLRLPSRRPVPPRAARVEMPRSREEEELGLGLQPLEEN